MQRVSVGRALIKKPTFCFVDEPTGALNWVIGERVFELLRGAAHERGATILVVAHDARARHFADREFTLYDGRGREPSRWEAYEK
jgi:putative ABC transport system ATP-binding protein